MGKTGLTLVFSVALLAACAACAVLFSLYRQEVGRNEELAAQLTEMTEKESRAAVMQSINAQMEEIATQERKVSDRQREEAIQQRKVAEEERQNALEQRRQAEEQRQNALTAEKKAVEASNVAQHQRVIAEDQREKAELAKHVADTLTYLAMGRNLGQLAVTQKNAGNDQLANLLAYAAYMYTKRYNGDIYNPAVYQALSLTSASSRKWNVGFGAVMKMWAISQGDETFITVSTYSEIVRHTKAADGNLHSDLIFQNNTYDFRDMVIDKHDVIYALSHTGHIVFGQQGNFNMAKLENAVHPFRLFEKNEGELLVVAEHCTLLLDAATMKVKKRLPLNFKTTVAGEDDKQLLLFDTRGQAYTVDTQLTSLKQRELPFKPQPIMSYTYDRQHGYEAYGTMDGPILVVDKKGNVNRLVGHRSRVPRVKFDGERLYSTSYDGTVKFWPFTQQKVEAMTIINTKQWVVCFTFDKTMKYIWTGDPKGNIVETLIDAHLMADRVHSKLKREFTREEWDYYIGRNIPYEKLK